MVGRLFAKSPRISWLEGGIFGLITTYFLLNLFRLGGNVFVFNLNNVLAAPLALVVTGMAFALWRHVAVNSQSRLLWSGLALGWLLWAGAEVWWAVAAFRGQEVPYPSGADVFWLAGYLPMYVALWARIKSLPQVTHPLQKVGLWVTSVFSLGWIALFVFAPILKKADPNAIVESALNLTYPLADLVLFLLVLRIFFTFQKGMYGRAWSWLAVGFILHSVSDLLFVYATTVDLYYPAQTANLLSTLGIDFLYNLSYLMWVIGLWVLQRMLKSYPIMEDIRLSPVLIPNTHVIVFTKKDDRVAEVSRNFSQFFGDDSVAGKTLSEALGVDAAEIENELTVLKRSQVLKERPVRVQTRFGQQEILLSAITVTNPQGEYSGSIFLLRLWAENPSLDDLLTDYQKGMVRFLLQKVGVKEEDEIKQALTEYYRAFLRGFYNRALSTGGSVMAEALMTTLEAVANQNHWQILIQAENFLDTHGLSLAEAQHALPALYETAKQFIAQLEDEQVANQIVQEVSARFDRAVIQTLARFEADHDRFLPLSGL